MGLFGEPSVNDGLRNDVVGVTEILVVDENCSHYPSVASSLWNVRGIGVQQNGRSCVVYKTLPGFCDVH